MLKFFKKLTTVPFLKRIVPVSEVPVENPPKPKRKPMANTKPIVWIDMEMTGLDVHQDRIMEIACLITDHQLNIIAEGPNVIIKQPDALLQGMNEWCTKTHTATGLYKACQESKITESQAEDMVLTFIQQYTKRNEAPLAGNTIYMDRFFLMHQMEKVNNYLNYRIIDVSSIKECCQRWNPEMHKNAPPKKLVHRALDDIHESIKELQYYKEFMFIK
ncbi:oligoribonuclease, mitochondrial [Culicoides brevitarsis]|uniref:oligoribonuclease, mitochondrial n=1 Tax=Culicoides brevitarsis TaxID=469753 RepID=UPI00307B51B6